MPCDGKQGIFDEFIEPERAREIIDLLKVNSEANQGYALREFLRQFLQHDEAISTLKNSMDNFERSATVNATDTAQLRMRKHFAVLYAAAALAIEYDLLPWKKTATFKAIASCMNGALREKALSDDTSMMTPKPTTAARMLKEELAKLQLMRIVKRKPLTPDESNLRACADGFDFGSEIYVKPDRWKAVSDQNREELIGLKILKTERDDVSTVARKLKGIPKKQRYHVINATALKSLTD